MQKILVPTDFSATATKAAMYAAAIAKKSNASVYLMHIIDPVTDKIHLPYALHGKLEEEIVNNRHKELVTLQNTLFAAYPSVETKTELAKGMVSNSIADHARKNQVDLIVMGTKGATGLKEIFLGSVAAATIGRTKIPVLTIPDDYEMEEPDGILFATNNFE